MPSWPGTENAGPEGWRVRLAEKVNGCAKRGRSGLAIAVAQTRKMAHDVRLSEADVSSEKWSLTIDRLVRLTLFGKPVFEVEKLYTLTDGTAINIEREEGFAGVSPFAEQ